MSDKDRVTPGRPRGPDRTAFPARIETALLDAVRRSAEADLQSVNSQIEILLREALRRRGVEIRPAQTE